MFGKGREPGWREVYLTVKETDDTENLRLGKFIKDKIGWDKTSKDKLRAIIEIASDVVVYSDEASIPALSINAEDFRSYDQLFLIVRENAKIYGSSGAQGAGGGIRTLDNTIQVDGAEGGSGGTAVFADRPVKIINHGKIYGGGGGGGGGGGHKTTASSGGSSSTRCEGGKKGEGGGQHCCPVIEKFTKEVCKK